MEGIARALPPAPEIGPEAIPVAFEDEARHDVGGVDPAGQPAVAVELPAEDGFAAAVVVPKCGVGGAGAGGLGDFVPNMRIGHVADAESRFARAGTGHSLHT